VGSWISTRDKDYGGETHWRRNSSGEMVDDVAITLVYGSLAGMAGVGRTSCAGGEARRRRGFRPNHDGIVQSSELGSFTRSQGGRRRKSLENGLPGSSVYARRQAAKVRRGRSRCSGEAESRFSLGKASRLHGEAVQGLGRG
jgi:hypothetical protein